MYLILSRGDSGLADYLRWATNSELRLKLIKAQKLLKKRRNKFLVYMDMRMPYTILTHPKKEPIRTF